MEPLTENEIETLQAIKGLSIRFLTPEGITPTECDRLFFLWRSIDWLKMPYTPREKTVEKKQGIRVISKQSQCLCETILGSRACKKCLKP
jgi:hypothetical protein